MLQEIFDVILNVPLDPDAEPIETVAGEAVRLAADPAWVTVTVWFETPEPVTVTIADRAVVPGFAELAVTVIVALFEPLVGDTVSQDWSSVMLQEIFDVILNVPLDPEAEPIETVAGDAVRLAADPAWVTVTV